MHVDVKLAPDCAGLLRDLYEFDPLSLTWTEHEPSRVRGDFPVARSSSGFTSANDRLFVFGGTTLSGNRISSHEP
jgi:hypothetical protein